MAHGAPDYYGARPQATTYKLDDMAELAVRLGAIPSIDRLGDVQHSEGFEQGMNRGLGSGVGGGAAPVQSNAQARTGGYSALFAPGAVIGDSSFFAIKRTVPSTGKLGLEFSVYQPTPHVRIWWIFEVDTPTQRGFYQVRWDVANGLLQYRNTAGAFVTFASGIVFDPSFPGFVTGKLVVDNDLGYYARFRLGATTYDLTSYQAQTAALTPEPQVMVGINVDTIVAVADNVYIDDVLLTINEA